jgi:Uma2 family endonuclease
MSGVEEEWHMSMGASRVTKEPTVPPLENGDQLTIAEFERRYEAMPHVKKAELIDGVVYMPSPVTTDDHGEQHFDLIGWLGAYRAHTPGVQGADNATLRLLVGANEPQPDAFLRIRPEYGGQSSTSNDGYVVGAPEWIGEVSGTTASYDLHAKLLAYQHNGVQEYVVWRVRDHWIDWFVLQDGSFRPMQHRRGIFRSKVFPGLWLDAISMLNGDVSQVLEVLARGIKSDEHRRFVARLARRKRRNERNL